MNQSGSGLLYFGSFFLRQFFWISDSLLLLVTGLIIFSISSIFSFGRLHVFRNLFISARLANLLA